MFANLPEFANWLMEQPLSSLRPPKNAVYSYVTAGGAVHSLVLYRSAPYQAELFFGLPAGSEGFFPEHSHPNVDSIEVMMSGQIGFTLRGRPVNTPDEVAGIAPDGSAMLLGARVRVREGVSHGAKVGPGGGAFLSLQRWRDGVEPTSVGLDWDGPPHIEIRP